jgi:hypothetical protein
MQQKKHAVENSVLFAFLVLREKLLRAKLNDAASRNDANEGVLVVYHGNKILGTGPIHQIPHGSGDPNRYVVSPPGNFHDPVGFCLANIHVAHIFNGPQKIAFCQSAPVFTLFIENGEGGKVSGFHLFQGLAYGIVIIEEGTHGLRLEEK